MFNNSQFNRQSFNTETPGIIKRIFLNTLINESYVGIPSFVYDQFILLSGIPSGIEFGNLNTFGWWIIKRKAITDWEVKKC